MNARFVPKQRRLTSALVLAAVGSFEALAGGRARPQAEPPKPAETVARTEHFDRDPGWEGHNNHVTRPPVTVTQDFGFSATNKAGKAAGEIGGQVWRSTTPAYYADRISPRGLDDRLTASGAFALTATAGGSGLFFGWFNADTLGSGRNRNTLGWYLDGEKTGARMLAIVNTGTNRAHGAFVTPFRRGVKMLPLLPDGSRHSWKLSYDPRAADGKGALTFTLDGKEPVVTEFPAGFKKEGATFNRFGLMNTQKGGRPLTVYLGDLAYDGKAQDFARDPRWEGKGNRVTFQDGERTGAHHFGFSDSRFAGGKAGEVGGLFWRAEKPFGYYADCVGPLTLDDPLAASGKVAFTVGAPDSAMMIGWFQSDSKDDPPERFRNFLGISLEGPSRIGHYFRPIYATAKGATGDPRKGPVLVPDGKPHAWSLAYDPNGNGGRGTIRVSLDAASVTLNLAAGHKGQGARFDRFGLLTVRAGGSQVKVYFDDLTYTAGRRP
jgi:hypothetical protein